MIARREYQSAKEVMSDKIVFIDGMATAKEAVDLMKKEKVDALIVNKRNEFDAYGIVVITDFVNGVIIPDRKSESVNVFEIMSKPVFCIPADMDVRYVARLLIETGVRTAPVEENRNLIGMISLTQLILENRLF